MRRPLHNALVISAGISIVWTIGMLIIMDLSETRYGISPESDLMALFKAFGVGGLGLFLCSSGILWVGAFRFLLTRWQQTGPLARILWIYFMLFAPVITPFVCFFVSYRATPSGPAHAADAIRHQHRGARE